VIGCPAHTTAVPDVGVDDPSDPNYIPPIEGEGGVITPGEPVQPELPTPPPEPSVPTDPSGGEGSEDWWDDLWEEPA